MYSIVIEKQARKKLKSLSKLDRVKISEAIYMMSLDLRDSRLNIKKLLGKYSYRLKVSKWRIIFTKDDAIKIILIEKIGSRGDVYK